MGNPLDYFGMYQTNTDFHFSHFCKWKIYNFLLSFYFNKEKEPVYNYNSRRKANTYVQAGCTSSIGDLEKVWQFVYKD